MLSKILPLRRGRLRWIVPLVLGLLLILRLIQVNSELIRTKVAGARELSIKKHSSYNSDISLSIQKFPKRIQQISAFKQLDPKSKFAKFKDSWIVKNPDYKFVVFDDAAADELVKRLYLDNRPDIYAVYKQLRQRIIAVDLLRYIILYEFGGIYTDRDTECTRPISEWPFPKDESTFNIVVGLEADERDSSTFDDEQVKKFGFVYRLQLLQWTIMSKPAHPVLARAIDKIVEAVISRARKLNVPISSLQYTQREILHLSGPGLFTDAVKEHLKNMLQRDIKDSELSTVEYNNIVGDVLVLPVNAWAPGQRHSRSGSSVDSMVYHGFAGSWRSKWPGWLRFLGIG